MKFAFKSIVAAAAFVAVGAASAATQVINAGQEFNGLSFTGGGSLVFSDTLVGALNTGKVAAGVFGGATSQIIGSAGAYEAIGVTANVTSLTLDTATNEITYAVSTGGATQQAAYLASVLTGGSASVGNLQIDLVNGVIKGDLFGTSLAVQEIRNSKGVITQAAAPAKNVDLRGIDLFTFTDITGPTALTGVGTYTTTFNGLALTDAGFAGLTDALGLISIGKIALQGASQDFGTLTSVITVTAVPEPSTYALMGVGLVGLSLVARRRAK